MDAAVEHALTPDRVLGLHLALVDDRVVLSARSMPLGLISRAGVQAVCPSRPAPADLVVLDMRGDAAGRGIGAARSPPSGRDISSG